MGGGYAIIGTYSLVCAGKDDVTVLNESHMECMREEGEKEREQDK